MKPSRMFAVLRQCGAASRLLPEIDRLYGMSQNAQHLLDLESGAGIHVMMALDHAAARGYGLTTRYAVVMRDAGHRRLKAPRHAANWRPWSRANTRISIERLSWMRMRWCDCWNDAMRYANLNVLLKFCRRARRIFAGARVLRKRLIRRRNICVRD